ncbi:MAG: citramalate synthase [Chlamydiae bacterium]|nr:citramalate synthase [Chlamydiota bacterium]MBI3277490.1 citramalate synthase [Chlamydiota bacterium]
MKHNSLNTDKIKIYDTTLRDGAQAAGISFSSADKLRIVERLDAFGIPYIEGGWPGATPKEVSFFKDAKKLKLKQARLVAFGSTRKAGLSASADPQLKALLEAQTPSITIFGKSWTLHVEKVLGTSLEENLEMIRGSVHFLKSEGREVIYDAEHFFDGYKANSKYALQTLKAAQEGGADWLCLCDTNGGTLTLELQEVIQNVREVLKTPLGIHAHNDGGLAVSNSIIAVQSGVLQVQGTINGYGERCGNANLCTIIPNLQLKLGYSCISDSEMKNLIELSKFVDEIANVRHDERAPYVGMNAFAHKGGTHVHAVQKVTKSFEHVEPECVGNRRRILVSEMSGRSNIMVKAIELGVDLAKEDQDPQARKIVQELKKLEHEGYEYEGAEASFKLLMRKILEKHKSFFELEGFRVIVEKRGQGRPTCEATIKVKVDGISEHTAAEGDGPVNALDHALRKALMSFYPNLAKAHLEDFKVRVLDAKGGTGAKVRVLIESKDDQDLWGTVGVSENIIEASWEALVDSLEYKLLKDEEGKSTGDKLEK